MRAAASTTFRALPPPRLPPLPLLLVSGTRFARATPITTTTTRAADDDHDHPPVPPPPQETAATGGTAAVAARLRALDSAAAAFASSRPDVDGLGKLRARIRRDLKRAEDPSAASRAGTIEGARNNARGYSAELAVASAAPRVVAVCFSAAAAVADPSQSSSSSSIEVDVVCEGGATWIEVKAHRPFSRGSAHWSGVRGLRAQASALLAAARDEKSNRAAGFRAPRVVVLFARGVDPSVAEELREMGAVALGERRVLVANGGDEGGGGEDDEDDDETATAIEAACRAALASLPPLPPSPYPLVINLDVTALCALVSEVSWVAAEAAAKEGAEASASAAAALDAWAARTPHWRECLAAERANPLLFRFEGARRAWRSDTALARAGRWVFGCGGGDEDGDDKTTTAPPLAAVIASAAAVRQFDVLATLHAGERERARWERLRGRVEVVAEAADEGGEGGRPPQQQQQQQQQQQSQGLRSTPLALAVLGLGGRRRALTVTANGSGVRSAREHWARRRCRRPGRRRDGDGGEGGGQGGGATTGAAAGGGEGAWTDDAAAGAMEAELHRAVWLAGV